MKKGLLISLLAVAISACSTDTPTPQKLSSNIMQVPSGTVISTKSMMDLPKAKDSQAIVKLGSFKVKDNVYDADGKQLLVKTGSIITGLYTNNGVNCTISWKAIYANKDDFYDQKAALAIENSTDDSACDPMVGVNSGDVATIRFK